jgi:hypothetical protein
MAEHLLPSIGEKTLVLAIDQLEDINRLTYKNEFFKMLRVWHERRANWKYSALWKRLNMVFVTSTEPYDLMDDQTSSPFNVGEVIEPPDFSSKDIETLNKLYNYPFNGDQVNQLSKLLCGHPYLVRKALWLVATERMTAADLFDHAADELGPFGDHLRHHLFNLRNKDGFLTELRQIINNKKSSNEEVFYDLRGAGLLRGEFKSGEFRCPLYEEYFRRHL